MTAALPPVPLSVLDLAPVLAGAGPADALEATLTLARRADELGLTRFWVAEHHNMPGIASSAPAVLIGAVAAATDRIRVGSGGVMLPNHPPLVVAEQFGTLAALHPGRIDLGLGRAPGTDGVTAMALRRTAQPGADDFPEQLGQLGSFLAGEWPEGHPYARIRAVPHADAPPPIWLLGSSLFSAELAGVLGLPFAFAHHFSAANTDAAFDVYRRVFRPNAALPAPYAMLTVQVVCGADDAEADRLALPGALSFLRLRQGRPEAMPSVADAVDYPWRPEELDFVRQRRVGQAVGGPDSVRGSLADLLDRYAPDELMITTQVYDPVERVRSLERTRALFDDLPVGLQQPRQLSTSG